MASKHVMIINNTTTFLLLFILSSTYSVVATLSNITQSHHHDHEAICNSTPHPIQCLSNLPPNQTTIDLHTLSRFFLRKSLTTARHVVALVDAHLRGPTLLPAPTLGALEDCRFLAQLTLENIARTHSAINATDVLDPLEAEDFETLLSAVLTNQETCLQGLEEVSSPPSLRELIGARLDAGKKLYSVSLALFKRGWVDKDDDDDDDDEEDGKREKGRKLIQSGPDLGGVLVSGMVVVCKNGSGNYTRIGEAVNAAPNNSAMVFGRARSVVNSYFVIYVRRGVYEEYVSIGTNKQNLMMVGDGINQTIITGNRSVVDGWTTYNSATFAVTGQGFIAINITFRNTAGAIMRQAVAVRNGADISAFRRCSFEGYQDTLYAHSLRQFYRDCDIYGTIDFIFGDAAVVLQNCNIFARRPLPNQFNVITAQGRSDPNQNTGTSIHNCAIHASSELANANANVNVNVNVNVNATTTRTYLGRPWREYSRTVFMQSFMGDLIDPAGWREWSGNFGLTTLYYAEFNNSGPGSNTSQRVSWPGYFRDITVNEAANFTVSGLIAGDAWLLGTTGVPYTAGLMV